MANNDILQLFLYLTVLLLLVKPLGLYMALIYEDKPCFINQILKPVEQKIYRFCGVSPQKEMHWKEYTIAILIFGLINVLIVYALQRVQAFLPLNPQNFPAVSPDLAFNTAVSFVTNTNWQAYSGENTLSYFTQMMALTVQNFLSAATAMSVLMAFVRGIKRQQTSLLGNFWVDTIRGLLYIFIPFAIILAALLISQGVIQNFQNYQTATLIEPIQQQKPLLDLNGNPIKDPKGKPVSKNVLQQEQLLPMGPVASQVAIKQLGTNGGGYFNANSAHPFENPTPFSNFLEMLAILLIPAAICYSFGVLIQDTRQGWTILCTMLIIFLPFLAATIVIEQAGNNALLSNFAAEILPHSGNMEGKEVRFGTLNASLWAVATTASGNGSVNALLDSFMPLSGAITLLFLDLGEIIFGGVGSGLYQMLVYVIITVFVCGLMIGRTPEYLGKRIEPYEIKMASLAILIMPLTVLIFTAISLSVEAGKSSIANSGPHGFTEVLYAFSSMTNNNGSAFAGINANTCFYNTLGGIAILIGRYWIIIPIIAIAGSLAKKKTIPVSVGTLPTHGPLFIGILVSIILILGALTFFPALALGPIVEQLMNLKT